LLAGLVPATATSSSAQAYGNPFLEVKKTASGYTVEAENATLPQVLSALGAQAGFSVQDSGAMRPPIPFFEASDASLESMLRRLLESTNHLIVYRGGTDQREITEGSIDRIVLLSPVERRQTPPSGGGATTSSLAGPPGTQAPPRAPRQPPPQPGQRPQIAPPPGMPADQGSAGVPPLPDPATAFPPDMSGAPGSTVYSEDTLAEMERQAIEQLGVGAAEVTGEPGAQPEIPPDLRERLEAGGYDPETGEALQ
jgi:hypothetical protein